MGLVVLQPMLRRWDHSKRYYVKLVAKRFEPTELGEIVNKLIVEFFPDIVNVTFTAEMEGKLDDVELGKEEWQKSSMPSTNHSLKRSQKAEEEMEKSKSKTNQLVLIVKFVVARWWLS